MLKQSVGTLVEHETENDIATQGDKPGTSCMGSLSLGKEVFRPEAILTQLSGAGNTACRRLPFPAILY